MHIGHRSSCCFLSLPFLYVISTIGCSSIPEREFVDNADERATSPTTVATSLGRRLASKLSEQHETVISEADAWLSEVWTRKRDETLSLSLNVMRNTLVILVETQLIGERITCVTYYCMLMHTFISQCLMQLQRRNFKQRLSMNWVSSEWRRSAYNTHAWMVHNCFLGLRFFWP